MNIIKSSGPFANKIRENLKAIADVLEMTDAFFQIIIIIIIIFKPLENTKGVKEIE